MIRYTCIILNECIIKNVACNIINFVCTHRNINFTPCCYAIVIHKPYYKRTCGCWSRQPFAGGREKRQRRRWRRQRGSTMVNKNMSCGKYANNLWPVGRTRPRGRDRRWSKGEKEHGALFSSTHSLRPRRRAAEMVATRIAPKIQNTLHRRTALRNNNKTRASTPLAPLNHPPTLARRIRSHDHLHRIPTFQSPVT